MIFHVSYGDSQSIFRTSSLFKLEHWELKKMGGVWGRCGNPSRFENRCPIDSLKLQWNGIRVDIRHYIAYGRLDRMIRKTVTRIAINTIIAVSDALEIIPVSERYFNFPTLSKWSLWRYFESRTISFSVKLPCGVRGNGPPFSTNICYSVLYS